MHFVINAFKLHMYLYPILICVYNKYIVFFKRSSLMEVFQATIQYLDVAWLSSLVGLE